MLHPRAIVSCLISRKPSGRSRRKKKNNTHTSTRLQLGICRDLCDTNTSKQTSMAGIAQESQLGGIRKPQVPLAKWCTKLIARTGVARKVVGFLQVWFFQESRSIDVHGSVRHFHRLTQIVVLASPLSCSLLPFAWLIGIVVDVLVRDAELAS